MISNCNEATNASNNTIAVVKIRCSRNHSGIIIPGIIRFLWLLLFVWPLFVASVQSYSPATVHIPSCCY